uniref:Uncharacterized protein n=1 Tax=Setaria italica TaxID=4555 RepID=K3ZD58_SETIT
MQGDSGVGSGGSLLTTDGGVPDTSGLCTHSQALAGASRPRSQARAIPSSFVESKCSYPCIGANFRAFISGKSITHLRLSLPCGVVLIVWVIFHLVSAKFPEIPRYVSVVKENASPLRKGSWFGTSGIDFLFMLASRMLLLMIFRVLVLWSTKP